MLENDSDKNAGKKQKGQCDLSLSHASSASFFENNSRHGNKGSAHRLAQNAIFGRNVHKALFGSDLVKLKQETGSIKHRALCKEVIDYHLLMALACHDLPRKKKLSVVQFVRSSIEKIHGSNFLCLISSKRDVHRINGLLFTPHSCTRSTYDS